METQNTHQSIIAQKDGSASEKQVNYLVALYKESIKKAITKSMKGLDKNSDYMNFQKQMTGYIRGKFALHAWVSFIPANGKVYTKNKVSEMIYNAVNNNKFDTKFSKALVTSCNQYTLESRQDS